MKIIYYFENETTENVKHASMSYLYLRVNSIDGVDILSLKKTSYILDKRHNETVPLMMYH